MASRDIVELAREVGRAATPYVEEHDHGQTFVSEGYDAIRQVRYGAAAVPEDLGGDGAEIVPICRAQRELGRACASTALAISMHHHTVLSLSWQRRHGNDAFTEFLKRLAAEPLIMSSSGTLDPSAPSLTYEHVEGGVCVTGSKRLSSGSPGADYLFSLGGDSSGQSIANMAIPLEAEGVTIVDDWYAMGMRGSGSNSVRLENAFVPTDCVFSERPRPQSDRPQQAGQVQGATLPGLNPSSGQGGRGPLGRGRSVRGRPGGVSGVRMPGLMIALPVITASYMGVVDEVYEQALVTIRGGRHPHDPTTHALVGEMHSAYRSADMAFETMIGEVNDDTVGTEQLFRTVMICKRLIVVSGLQVAQIAMELIGAQSYMEGSLFERSLRDLRAAVTHPMSPALTLSEVGRSLVYIDD